MDEFSLYFENGLDYIAHEGRGHDRGGHSGRYPWGSGENPYQHGPRFYADRFLAEYNELKKQGLSQSEIFTHMGWGDIGTERMNAIVQVAKGEVRRQKILKIRRLYDNEFQVDENGNYILDSDGNKIKNPCYQNASETARAMGMITANGKPQDTSVRKLLDTQAELNKNRARATADKLKELMETNLYLDIGSGTEIELGISEHIKAQAIEILRLEGYNVFTDIKVKQPTNPKGFETTFVILGKDDPSLTTNEKRAAIYEAIKNDQIGTVKDYHSEDNGQTFHKWTYPDALDSSRLQICYNEEGGILKDGLIELRRGVEELSLGADVYSQVRIRVDDNLYLKGMAVYSDDLPPGVDVRFNTNKHVGTPIEKVLKTMKGVNGDDVGPDNPVDKNNPFGSAIKEGAAGQRWYTDPVTGEEKLSYICKRAEEGDWEDWNNALPSQFLSKQDPILVKKQLDATTAKMQADYEEICSLTNPVIKKYYLEKFADECDTAARELKAVALPGQKYQVLLPSTTISDNQVYAPNYPEGSTVALVRYPHGGIFEIPVLKVTHKDQDGVKMTTTPDGKNIPKDCVAVNKTVLDQLSGADTDGDTVVVIPMSKGSDIKHSKPLQSLIGYDAKEEYGTIKQADGTYINAKTGTPCKIMTKKNTQIQMGKITNLITDATAAGCPAESEDGLDLAHLVRHSQTVIDAAKHKLDYQASAIDNHIDAIKEKYQLHYRLDGSLTDKGAATIFSRATNEIEINKRSQYYHIDPETGKKIYKDSGQKEWAYSDIEKSEKTIAKLESEGKIVQQRPSNPQIGDVWYRRDKNGNVVKAKYNYVKEKVAQMDLVDDAHQLIYSDSTHAPTQNALLYADYANGCKAMANTARKEYLATNSRVFKSTAKQVYDAEVKSLNAKLGDAIKNRPKERKALVIATSIINAQMDAATHSLTSEEKRKIKAKAMTRARAEVGSIKRSDRNIKITDKEWEAIQAGAVSSTTLRTILDNTDPKELRQRAMPRANSISSAKISKIKSMLARPNVTYADIAAAAGVSVSTVINVNSGELG